MRVVHLNAFDRRGGAAIAVSRLHRALRAAGVDSQLLVQFQAGDAEGVTGPRSRCHKAQALAGDVLDPLPVLAYRRRQASVFSCNWVPSGAAGRAMALQPDLVHLHWVNSGMLAPRALRRLRGPVIWTLHDMWPFTGGCHYAADCAGYKQHCGGCPQLGSRLGVDLSRWTMRRKRHNWEQLILLPVAPSQWLAECATQSSLFRDTDVRVIPNGLDLAVWRPVAQAQARELLGLPKGPLLLFSAARGLLTTFKGGSTLLQALHELYTGGRRFTLLLMGNAALPGGLQAGFPVHLLGELQDDVSKVLAYSAADITVHSATQDNLPNTVTESLACGTPVAAMAVGGLSEMITDGSNGFLVPADDGSALAQALAGYLDTADQRVMSWAAREKAEASYDVKKVAAAYRSLYEEVVASRQADRITKATGGAAAKEIP